MKTIPLSKGMNAIVDDSDFDWLNRHKWTYHSNGYAMRSCGSSGPKKRKYIFMHRDIINPAAGISVDHRNGNRIDNRRENLRVATQSQNNANQKISARNTSGFKGVSFQKQHQKYRAQIVLNQKQKHLGYFQTAAQAASAYDTAALHYFGEFAKTNAAINQVEAA